MKREKTYKFSSSMQKKFQKDVYGCRRVLIQWKFKITRVEKILKPTQRAIMGKFYA